MAMTMVMTMAMLFACCLLVVVSSSSREGTAVAPAPLVEMGTGGSREEFPVASIATVTSPPRERPLAGSRQGSAVTDSPPPAPITEPTLQVEPAPPPQTSVLFHELGLDGIGLDLSTLQRRCDQLQQELQQSRVLIDRLVGRIMVLEEKLERVGRAASEPVPKAKARAY